MKKVLAKTENMSREEWLALRRKGIGASDCAPACGMSRYKSPLSLWLEKTEQVKPKEAGEAAYWGTIMEPVLREEFAKRTGLAVKEVPYMFYREETPWMLANIDGITYEKDGSVSLLEIKTANGFAAKDWEDGLPQEYFLQVQHYLCVLDLQKAYVACLLGGNHFIVEEVLRDDEVIANITAMEAAFWKSVVDRTQPEIDGSASTAEALSSMYPESDTTSVILPEEADDILSYYLKVKESEVSIKEEKMLCENKLKSLLGKNSCGKSPKGISVSWKSVETSRIDTTRLKTEAPQIAEQFTVKSQSRKFVVSTKGMRS